jgi:ribose transport system substrate-binding protein
MVRSAHTSRALLATLLVALAAALAACGSDDESGSASAGTGDNGATKDLEIGVMLFNTDLPFYAPLQKGIRLEAERQGVDVDIQNGQLDPARQAQIIQQFVTQKKDAIIISASDADAVVPAVKQANAANIPVLGLTNDVGKGAERLTYVGSDNIEFGRLLGQGVVETVGENAKVALILGALGTTSQRDRSKGFKEFMAKNPGIELLDEQAADWDNAKALKVGQDFLNKYKRGQIDAIVVQGPEGAAPAKAAVKSGRDDVKFIVGDISADVQQQLKAGTIDAAVFQDPYEQGQVGVRYAVEAASGKAEGVPNPFAYQPIDLFDSKEWSQVPEESLF